MIKDITKKTVLIDLSWDLYRSYYSFKDLKIGERPTGHIYGVCRTVMQILAMKEDYNIILCKDGFDLDRSTTDENYKAGRKELEYSPHKDTDLVLALLSRLRGVYIAYDDKQEADDLMFSLSKVIDNQVIIFSGDNDLLQSVNDRVVVARGIDKGLFKIIDREYIRTNERMVTLFRNTETENLSKYRAIVGDSSDNLKGVYPRFPRALASKIANSFSIDEIVNREFLNMPVTKSEGKYLRELDVRMDVFEKNYKMMHLEYKPYNLTDTWEREGLKQELLDLGFYPTLASMTENGLFKEGKGLI